LVVIIQELLDALAKLLIIGAKQLDEFLTGVTAFDEPCVLKDRLFVKLLTGHGRQDSSGVTGKQK
jgi:hypothetical protein